MTEHGKIHTDGSRSGGQPVNMTDDTQSAVLLPCPFCRTNNQLKVEQPFEPEDETSVVVCNKCNASGPYYGGSDSTSEAEAVELWSRRDGLDALLTKAENALALRQPTQSDALRDQLLQECLVKLRDVQGTEASKQYACNLIKRVERVLQEQSK
jgi:Lar family restriction alleviation protein